MKLCLPFSRADVSRVQGMSSAEVPAERMRKGLDGARVGEGFRNDVCTSSEKMS